ncbi:MAG: glutamate racemase [Deltaproteobacteria bacterium]|nr:MAG: glutamate racemase [Deltaproteobacteria bacterium]
MAGDPIGVFDSGVGGLTVVAALRAALPGESIVYLGDTARVPYGTKSPRTVVRYAEACQRFLLARGVKLVMVACNTASATALGALRAATAVPVIGAVEPGACSAVAASRGGHIGVIGTLSTVRSGAYEQAIAAIDGGAVVTSVACPLFVPLAEEGWVDGDIVEAVARRYLEELWRRDPDIDTLVLGCTHYPLLRQPITAVATALAGREVAIVDSATAMAEAAIAAVGDRARDRTAAGALRCFVTDASRLDELAPRFLGEPLASYDLADL